MRALKTALVDECRKLGQRAVVGKVAMDRLAPANYCETTAASIADRVELEAEYHALFIGLGRGELLPYASTYLTGFLQEQPLADVRQDFARLGFVRQEGVHEPEDHAGSLCQAMAALILAPDDYSTEEQHQFFTRHVGSWMSEFFSDLAGAKQAVF